MIGAALHLLACAADRAQSALAPLGWAWDYAQPTEALAQRAALWVLTHVPQGTPEPGLVEQVERLGAECDVLRDERDTALAELAELRAAARAYLDVEFIEHLEPAYQRLLALLVSPEEAPRG